MQQPSSVIAPVHSQPSRSAVTFLIAAVYVALVIALVQSGMRFYRDTAPPLLTGVITVLLLAGGLLWIAATRMPDLRPLSAIGFVRRPSAGTELALGAALGWAIAVLLVLPAALTLRLHTALRLDGAHLVASFMDMLVLLLFVLGRQLIFCGLPFRTLTQATSPLFASVAFAGIAALLTAAVDHGDTAQACVAGLAQSLFCTAAARTRAIWIGTALQFAWGMWIAVFFGLPSFLWPLGHGAAVSILNGPRWAIGGFLGPEAALWGALVIAAALSELWRLTRDYAWHYTFDPLVGAGYPMEVAPPAEHSRMEQQESLVQIGVIHAESESLPRPPHP